MGNFLNTFSVLPILITLFFVSITITTGKRMDHLKVSMLQAPTGETKISRQEKLTDKRVPIGGNCEAIINNKALIPTATGLKDSVTAIKAKNVNELYLYVTLDSVRTLLYSIPDQRKTILDHCNGVDGNENWISEKEGQNEFCFMPTASYKPARNVDPDAEGMQAFVLLGEKLSPVYQMSTKTIAAKKCFQRIKSLVVTLPTFTKKQVLEVAKASGSLEDTLFGNIHKAKNKVAVVLYVERPTGTFPNFETNENLKIGAIFLSVNDSVSPIHHQPVVGLMDQSHLQNLATNSLVTFDMLLRNFGFQVVVINDTKLDKETIKQIKTVSLTTGASVFVKNVEIAGLKELPANFGEFMNTRKEAPDNPTLVLRRQVLVIGPQIDAFGNDSELPCHITVNQIQGLPKTLAATAGSTEPRKKYKGQTYETSPTYVKTTQRQLSGYSTPPEKKLF